MDAVGLADLVLAVLAVEALVLWWLGRRSRRLPPFARLWPNLAAGLCLVLAVRAALTGAGVAAIALALALGGAAHVADLWMRMRD